MINLKLTVFFLFVVNLVGGVSCSTLLPLNVVVELNLEKVEKSRYIGTLQLWEKKADIPLGRTVFIREYTFPPTNRLVLELERGHSYVLRYRLKSGSHLDFLTLNGASFFTVLPTADALNMVSVTNGLNPFGAKRE